MRKALWTTLVMTLLAGWTVCAAAAQSAAKPATPPESGDGPGEQAEAAAPTAVLHTSLGDITIGFYPEAAPNHVENFLDLARSGFYDGTLFHRVIPGFMIQGGDPLSKDDDPRNDGTGNGPRRLKAEFSGISHERGIVSMARSPHPDSASCQFFIMHKDTPRLDGQYSVFGHVIEGMDVVDRIAATKTGPRDRPLEDVVIRSVEVLPAKPR